MSFWCLSKGEALWSIIAVCPRMMVSANARILTSSSSAPPMRKVSLPLKKLLCRGVDISEWSVTSLCSLWHSVCDSSCLLCAGMAHWWPVLLGLLLFAYCTLTYSYSFLMPTALSKRLSLSSVNFLAPLVHAYPTPLFYFQSYDIRTVHGN